MWAKNEEKWAKIEQKWSKVEQNILSRIWSSVVKKAFLTAMKGKLGWGPIL
jgi:hypothetical protein